MPPSPPEYLKPDACADLILDAYLADTWRRNETADALAAHRRDIRTGLAAALRHASTCATPAGSFELLMLADQIDPAAPLVVVGDPHPPCPNCRPTVHHVAACRASFARCEACGRTGAPHHWPSADVPIAAADHAISNFRSEHHHAD